MKDVVWSDNKGNEVQLVEVEEDDTVMVDGQASKVEKGTLLQKGKDNVGYSSFDEDQWSDAGFSESKTATKKTPDKK